MIVAAIAGLVRFKASNDQLAAATLAQAKADHDARQNEDTRAARAGTLYFQGGVNDIAQNYPTATTSGQTAASNIITMAEMARLSGLKVVIEAEVGANGLTAAEVGQVNALNTRRADYVEGTANVYLNDARSAVMNPTAGTTTLTFKSGYSLDGTHEVSRGAYYPALPLLPLLNPVIPPSSVLTRAGAELPGNGRWQLLANPIFATATSGTLSGTATGTVPSGWSAFGSAGATATFGTQADADGMGNNVAMTCQWVAAGDNCHLFQTVGSANWLAGDIVQAFAQVQVASASACLAAIRRELVTLGTLSGTATGFNYMDGYHVTAVGSGVVSRFCRTINPCAATVSLREVRHQEARNPPDVASRRRAGA